MPVQLSHGDQRVTVTDAEIVSGGDTDTTYTIRLITREARREIVRKHTPARFNNGRRDEMNSEAISEDLVDYVLVAWTGILFDGQPADCSRTNKLLLDQLRLSALLERAGLSQVIAAEVAQSESFRPPA